MLGKPEAINKLVLGKPGKQQAAGWKALGNHKVVPGKHAKSQQMCGKPWNSTKVVPGKHAKNIAAVW